MKASTVVSQLRILLTQETGDFTTNVEVASVTRSGTELTIKTKAEHNLEVGQAVALTGAVTQISIGTLSRSGTVGTLVTDTNHDLTEPIASTVTISGANEAEFNGTFTRLEIKNRRTITFTMADSGPTSATGSPILQGAESALRDYNTLYEVKQVPNDHTFTVNHLVTDLLDPVGTVTARTKPRISAAVSVERLLESYTSGVGAWLYVVLEAVEASTNRNVQNDALDFIGRGSEYHQHVTQNFNLYLFLPCESEIAGTAARDQAEDLFGPICRSLLGSKFDSGLAGGAFGTVHFLRHGPYAYTSAFYVHEFSFQQLVDITESDTVGPDLDVAFRDIDITFDPDLGGTTVLTAEIDLDDEPL